MNTPVTRSLFELVLGNVLSLGAIALALVTALCIIYGMVKTKELTTGNLVPAIIAQEINRIVMWHQLFMLGMLYVVCISLISPGGEDASLLIPWPLGPALGIMCMIALIRVSFVHWRIDKFIVQPYNERRNRESLPRP